MTDDRYIVVQGQGYYGPLYVAQDTQTGRLQHAPDYRYNEAQKVADHANEYWLLRQERENVGDRVWTPVVDNAPGGSVVAMRTVDKRAS